MPNPTIALLAATAALSAPCAHAVNTEHAWSDASKEAVGTAFGRASSRVWFTVSHGILTETYYPRIDRAQVGDDQLLFITGGRFLEEKRDLVHAIAHPSSPPVPRPLIEARTPDDAIRFTKEILADPARDVIRVRYHFEALPDDAQVFVLHKPTADNDGAGDHGRVVRDNRGHVAFVGWDDQASPQGAQRYDDQASPGAQRYDDQASPQGAQRYDDESGEAGVQAVLVNTAVAKASVGLVGETDGWQDLHRNGRMTEEIAENSGNIAYTAQLIPTTDLELAIGFGRSPDAALAATAASLKTDFQALRDAYDGPWQAYAANLAAAPWLAGVPSDLRENLIWDALVVKAHEDKLNPGAIVASLSIPNLPAGVGAPDGRNTGGYHLVWPRDLFKSALALLRMGDVQTALDALRFMTRMEHDGKMAQNAWVDGRPFWSSEQMDEEAFPVLLAAELARAGVAFDPALRAFVNRRVRLLQQSNGLTQQDRWEEAPGYSPNTLAVMAAALARAGDPRGAQALLNTALVRTVSRQGPLSNAPYFLRVSQAGDPDAGALLQIANGGPALAEYRVLDGGFLEWLRWFPDPQAYFGPQGAALASVIGTTLPVYDNPDNGVAFYVSGVPFYRRYTSDNYGVGHVGGPWPILTLERALPVVDSNPAEAFRTLSNVLKMFGPGELCPEQLDADLRPMPYAASPLVWCHAEMIELAHRAVAGLNL